MAQAGRGFLLRDGPLVERLDGLVEQLRSERPGRRVTREGIAREILHSGLEDRRVLKQLGLPVRAK